MCISYCLLSIFFVCIFGKVGERRSQEIFWEFFLKFCSELGFMRRVVLNYVMCSEDVFLVCRGCFEWGKFVRGGRRKKSGIR